MGAVVFGDVQTSDDLKECLAIVRAGSPAWCRVHDEFESVACEVIGSALKGYDPNRGSFTSRLIVRSRSRVPRLLLRATPSRRVALEALPEPHEETDDPRNATLEMLPAAVAEETTNVDRFLAGLAPDLKAVAELLYEGLTQAEVAVKLMLHPRKVSRLAARLQPLAAAHFNRPDLLAA